MSFDRIAIRWTWVLVSYGMFIGPARSDQVWIEPQRPTSTQSDWFPRGIEMRTGEIVAFDAKHLRLRPREGAEELIVAAARVLWVEPDQASPLELEALKLFADGDYSSSLIKLPDILAAKPPVWRQQWITMTSAVAAWKSGRSEIALELVGQLDRRPLPPIAIAWLPIAWANRPSPPHAVEAANQRLGDPSPVVQLVAASWLLSTPQRNQAIAVLKQLERQPRKEIARFARILSWKIATPPEVVGSVSDWEAAINSLPMVWQSGPLTLLADKLQSANQLEAAKRIRLALELTPIHPHYEWIGSSEARR